jgi:hypothetical protein
MEHLLGRSSLLIQNALSIVDYPLYDNSQRILASADACDLTLQHGHALRTLLDREHWVSAPAMLRCQFEAMIRSLWTLYCAEDEQVSLMMATELVESLSGQNLPMAGDMLNALGKVPQASHPHALLQEFRQSGWKAMNSYVHGGVHALHRLREGFPEELAVSVLKLSNGLSILAVMHLAILTGRSALQKSLMPLHESYGECLPIRNVAPPAA